MPHSAVVGVVLALAALVLGALGVLAAAVLDPHALPLLLPLSLQQFFHTFVLSFSELLLFPDCMTLSLHYLQTSHLTHHHTVEGSNTPLHYRNI